MKEASNTVDAIEGAYGGTPLADVSGGLLLILLLYSNQSVMSFPLAQVFWHSLFIEFLPPAVDVTSTPADVMVGPLNLAPDRIQSSKATHVLSDTACLTPFALQNPLLLVN